MDLGYVQFQESINGLSKLPEVVKRNLLFEAFPRYMPINFADKPNFKGVKIFSYNARILLISRFLYKGAKDRWGRPLLEAYVLAINFNEFNKDFRDIQLIIRLLDSFAQKGIIDIDTFLSELKANSLFVNESRSTQILNLIKKLTPEFLSEVIGSIIEKRELIIPAHNEANALFIMAVLFIPKSILYKVSMSSVCINPLAEDKEDVVITNVKPENTKKPIVDFESKMVKNGKKNELIFFILNEIIQGSWFGFSQLELFNFMVDLLEAASNGKVIEPFFFSEKLRAMKKTVEKAERLHNLLKKNIKKIT